MSELDRRKAFIETLDGLNGLIKQNNIIFGAPLALFATQLKFLITLDAIGMKVFLTIAFLSFFYGCYTNLLGGSLLRWIILKEKLYLHGQPEKGLKYISRYEKIYSSKGFTLDEQGGLNFLEKYERRVSLAMLTGWGALCLTFLLAIWANVELLPEALLKPS